MKVSSYRDGQIAMATLTSQDRTYVIVVEAIPRRRVEVVPRTQVSVLIVLGSVPRFEERICGRLAELMRQNADQSISRRVVIWGGSTAQDEKGQGDEQGSRQVSEYSDCCTHRLRHCTSTPHCARNNILNY